MTSIFIHKYLLISITKKTLLNRLFLSVFYKGLRLVIMEEFKNTYKFCIEKTHILLCVNTIRNVLSLKLNVGNLEYAL